MENKKCASNVETSNYKASYVPCPSVITFCPINATLTYLWAQILFLNYYKKKQKTIQLFFKFRGKHQSKNIHQDSLYHCKR